MSAPVNSGAARAPQEPAEAAERRGNSRTRRTIMGERALAALEAELARQLHDAPSIASADGEQERPPRPAARHEALAGQTGKRFDDFLRELKHFSDADAAHSDPLSAHSRASGNPEQLAHSPAALGPRVRGDERARPTKEELVQAAANDAEPLVPARLDWRTRTLQPETVPWLERPERTSLFMRATRVTATNFSVVALVGVSALIVVLAAGGGRSADNSASETAQAVQSAATAVIASVWPARGAPDVTGSIGEKQDTSRIPPAAVASATGVAQSASTQAAPPRAEAAPPAEPLAVKRVVTTRIPVETAAVDAAPPAEVLAAQTAAAPAPARPATEQPDNMVISARSPQAAEAAPAPRTAAVTAHVNMRASAKSDAAVVGVVPEGKTVEIVACEQWCEVVYEGQKGFVFKKFVSGQ